jgi:hypothetical protein
VVAPRTVVVAADPARVAGSGGYACVAGKTVGAREDGHAAAGGCDELGTELSAHSGQDADHFGVRVLTKPGRDERVELGDLLVEGHHRLRQADHHVGGQLLAGQRGVLGLCRLQCGLRQNRGASDLAVAQPGLDTLCAGAADGSRCLVSRQENDGPLVGQVQRAFQGGKELQQLGAEPVDLAGAVAREVGAAG